MSPRKLLIRNLEYATFVSCGACSFSILRSERLKRLRGRQILTRKFPTQGSKFYHFTQGEKRNVRSTSDMRYADDEHALNAMTKQCNKCNWSCSHCLKHNFSLIHFAEGMVLKILHADYPLGPQPLCRVILASTCKSSIQGSCISKSVVGTYID